MLWLLLFDNSFKNNELWTKYSFKVASVQDSAHDHIATELFIETKDDICLVGNDKSDKS